VFSVTWDNDVVVPSYTIKGMAGCCREIYFAYLSLLPLSSTLLQSVLAVVTAAAGTLASCFFPNQQQFLSY